jgi:DNA-directed RNA polymerase specialized sigma24 family protein
MTTAEDRGNRDAGSGVYTPMHAQLAVHDPPMATAIPTPAPRPAHVPRPHLYFADSDLEIVDLDEELDATVRPPRLEFEDFYRDAYVAIARALTATLSDLDLATEATDEAMVRAYVRWEKIRDYDNPGGWVYRVGLNWARSARRRIGRALPFHEHHTVDAELSDPAPYAALRELVVPMRSVVVCRLLLDWSVDQTAAALHIKPGTVKSRLHRALAQLERSLGDHA